MYVVQELQFRKLNAVKDDVKIGVIRGGESTSIDVKDVVGYGRYYVHTYTSSTCLWLTVGGG